MKITDQRALSRGALSVPVFGPGGAQLGGLYRTMSDDSAAALLDGAWHHGVRFFDTAPYYGYARSEHRLGAVLARHPRNEFIVSTKVGRLLRPDASVQPGDDGWVDPLPFRPFYDYTHDGVMRSIDDSLQRLGLSHVDLLYMHDIGAVTHGDLHPHYWKQLTTGGGFRALESLRRSGVAQAVGLGVNEWQVVHASMREFDLDCTMLAGRYTLLEQESLSPLLDDCLTRGNAIVVAGAFNSGVLTGGRSFNYANAPAQVIERVRALSAVCREFDVALPAAALQFPLAHPAVVSCIAGAHNETELRQSIGWLETPIPQPFWQALHQRCLIDARAPLPAP